MSVSTPAAVPSEDSLPRPTADTSSENQIHAGTEQLKPTPASEPVDTTATSNELVQAQPSLPAPPPVFPPSQFTILPATSRPPSPLQSRGVAAYRIDLMARGDPPPLLDVVMLKLAGGLPPIVPTTDWRQGRARPGARTKRVGKWTLSGSSDGRQMRRWRKEGQPDVQDHFSKFNTLVDMFHYTNDEYEAHLQSPDWSREETDYLWDLCRQFELKWFVMADRYEWPGSARTVDDLKERYYSICSKLLPIRPHDPADPSYLETLRQHDFNKARELERKQTVATLLARTAEQVKEEELLVAELRRKEANDRRWDRERASAKGVFAKLDAASPHERAAIIAGPMGPGMGLLDPKRNKKRREDGLLPPGAGGMGGGGGAGYPYAAQAGFRDRSHLSLATITLDAQTPLRTQRLNAGTTLQSSRMSQVKSTLVQKVQQVMQEEFGLGAAPNMPTQNIMFAYDEVRNAVAALVELRKQVEKVEHELKMANVRKQNVLQHGVGIVTGQTLDVTNKRPASSSLVHPRDKKQKR